MRQVDQTHIDYPTSVCWECGSKNTTGDQTRVFTMWKGKCGVCGQEGVTCTNPRNYGWPVFELPVKPRGEHELQ